VYYTRVSDIEVALSGTTCSNHLNSPHKDYNDDVISLKIATSGT
jgi:hypothetical protein